MDLTLTHIIIIIIFELKKQFEGVLLNMQSLMADMDSM